MNWLWELFTKNLELKLLALALAIALWAAVGRDPITVASFRVPVEFINVPRHLELLAEEPSVHVRARGPSHLVRQAKPGDFAVRVNAATISGPGENTFGLVPARVGAPPGVEVVELTPGEVRVSFERIASKGVPVEPRFSGEPPSGYRVKAVSVTPPEVRIAGPESHIQAITAAATAPLDVSQLTEATTFTTSVLLSDPRVRCLPRTVQVRVELEAVKQGGSAPPGSLR